MSQQTLIDLLGWIGTILYLIAYLLVSIKRVEGDSAGYQAMNIIAGVLLVINTFYWRAYPSMGLNAAWIGIGLFTLGRKRWSKKNADPA